jgi:hypothetical protein
MTDLYRNGDGGRHDGTGRPSARTSPYSWMPAATQASPQLTSTVAAVTTAASPASRASPTSFDCSNVGANTVTLTATDQNSNVSTCTATVTVEDNIAPTAVCQNLTLTLDATGNASTTAAAVDNGSSDNCAIASLALSQTAFGCGDVGNNAVTLTVTDVNGNVSTCNATITVQDNVAPTALCQNVTVQLDANGQASISVSDIDNGSGDNCALASLTLDQTSFNCLDVGANTVTLTATDVNNNVTTCTATVTVEDTTAPAAVCQNITVVSWMPAATPASPQPTWMAVPRTTVAIAKPGCQPDQLHLRGRRNE